MPQSMPKGTKCTGCNLPIKVTELFVGYRFGGAVRFWHNRSRIVEDCWGEFLLERVRHVSAIYDVQTTKTHKLSSRPPTAP
ncbi:MAG: hypothetical protein ABSH13_13275 [Candidatus Acidiferrum sp.]